MSVKPAWENDPNNMMSPQYNPGSGTGTRYDPKAEVYRVVGYDDDTGQRTWQDMRGNRVAETDLPFYRAYGMQDYEWGETWVNSSGNEMPRGYSPELPPKGVTSYKAVSVDPTTGQTTWMGPDGRQIDEKDLPFYNRLTGAGEYEANTWYNELGTPVINREVGEEDERDFIPSPTWQTTISEAEVKEKEKEKNLPPWERDRPPPLKSDTKSGYEVLNEAMINAVNARMDMFKTGLANGEVYRQAGARAVDRLRSEAPEGEGQLFQAQSTRGQQMLKAATGGLGFNEAQYRDVLSRQTAKRGAAEETRAIGRSADLVSLGRDLSAKGAGLASTAGTNLARTYMRGGQGMAGAAQDAYTASQVPGAALWQTVPQAMSDIYTINALRRPTSGGGNYIPGSGQAPVFGNADVGYVDDYGLL
jgi:hypothetical protein